MIKVGSDFSGVGAFDQALRRLNIDYKTVYSCDMDKYARQSYIANYGEPNYYPKNVYHRIIPEDSLDIYMTSPPCQSFSLAGKRKGEDSVNGVLFYNSHEFIMKNKPRYFIFENVKGLLSDAKGRTFQTWLDMLGGKSVNGNPVIFPREDAAPYHIYHKVLNAKHFGVPQNRERVFIIGIRDDQDNSFKFPKPFHLTKRLKDVLESDVNEKYYLSDKAINSLINNPDVLQKSKVDPEIASALQSPGNACGNYKGMNAISINENTKKGYTTACRGDGFYINRPHQKRGVVQKKATPCIKTGGDIGILDITGTVRRLTPRECFRLMDFPDSFKFVCSDTQMYKQAGNSIVVNVLSEIINKLVK
tara:strand:+ start:6723 stop:7805 length:1083 start_codon:yes stop_codon:yes gene_type:complete